MNGSSRRRAAGGAWPIARAGPREDHELGYWLQEKWGIAAGYIYIDASLPEIATLPPTNVTATAAELQGDLVSAGSPASDTQVWLYWGETDGTNNADDWSHSNYLGTNMVGNVGTNMTGLTRGTRYSYRFRAQNDGGAVWSPDAVAFSAGRTVMGCRRTSTACRLSYPNITAQSALYVYKYNGFSQIARLACQIGAGGGVGWIHLEPLGRDRYGRRIL